MSNAVSQGEEEEKQEVEFSPTDVRIITEEEMVRAKDGIREKGNGSTLCEKIREIYNIAETISDDGTKGGIQRRCLVVFCYAKRMDGKLKEYHDRSTY